MKHVITRVAIILMLAGSVCVAQSDRRQQRRLSKPARFVTSLHGTSIFPRIRQMGYKAIRNERWKYIHYFELEGMDELYDLKADPYEMRNIIHQPRAAKIVEELKSEMQRHLKGPQ